MCDIACVASVSVSRRFLSSWFNILNEVERCVNARKVWIYGNTFPYIPIIADSRCVPPRVLNPDSVRIKQAKIDTLFKAQTLKANPIQEEKCKNLIATHKPSFIRFPNILRDGSVT